MGLFTMYGPDAVKMVCDNGGRVFLDLKFHDIPNTVAHAVKSACGLGVFMLNVHALGGRDMVLRAAEAASAPGVAHPSRVTILTSMDAVSVKEVGICVDLEQEVVSLARLSRQAGLDGVVASPNEISVIRKNIGNDFIIVTPGIRPAGAGKNDQKRTMTPGEAVKAGADYIVVGRPIIEAKDPPAAAAGIIKEMES
jgi:orotidine-5'-phosphate decarboxylase